MNKIILIVFIYFLIYLFLFYLIISKLNELLKYFKKYDLEYIHCDIKNVQLDVTFLRKAMDVFNELLVKIANHTYAFDEEKNEVTLI